MAHKAGLFVVEPPVVNVRLPTDSNQASALAAVARVAVEGVQGVRFIQDALVLQVIVPKWCNAHMLRALILNEVDAYFKENKE